MELKDWLTIFIPVVTVTIGFIINYRITISSFKKEILKQQKIVSLSKVTEILEQLMHTYQEIQDEGVKSEKKQAYAPIVKKMVGTLHDILLFGSDDACRIAAEWQLNIYSENDSIKSIAYIILLICQIRLDVTGNCPDITNFYKVLIKDYKDGSCDKAMAISNELVHQLKLSTILLATKI